MADEAKDSLEILNIYVVYLKDGRIVRVRGTEYNYFHNYVFFKMGADSHSKFAESEVIAIIQEEYLVESKIPENP